jgi:anaerobic selenocysteine-containing dehydrogenase
VRIASQADVLLQVRPGTDGALASDLIDVGIKLKLYDEAFVYSGPTVFSSFEQNTGMALTEADIAT